MYIHIAGWEYNHWLPEEAKLTRNEKRSLASLTGGMADFYKIFLLAAHDKISRFFSTPGPPCPPESPLYPFSDFSNSDAAPDQEQETKKPKQTTQTPTQPNKEPATAIPMVKEKDGLGKVHVGTLTSLPQVHTAFSIKVGDIETRQGYKNQSRQLMHTLTSASTLPNVEPHEFMSFSMHMVKVGQISILQAILTNQKQGPNLLQLDQAAQIHHSTFPVRLEKSRVIKSADSGNVQNIGDRADLHNHLSDTIVTTDRRCNEDVLTSTPFLGRLSPLHTIEGQGHAKSKKEQKSKSLLGLNTLAIRVGESKIEVQNRPKFNAPSSMVLRPTNNPLYIPPIKRKLLTTCHIPDTPPNQLSTPLTRPCSFSYNSTALLPLHTHTTSNTIPHQQYSNCNMDLTDEQIVEQFAALSSGGDSSQTVHLPQNGLANKRWNLCALARTVTDKSTGDQQFASTIMSAWGVDPSTEISILKRNLFLVQFNNQEDLHRVMNKGVWIYKNDVVILKRTTGAKDLDQPTVQIAEVWSRWHKIPPAAFSSEGIHILAHRLETPLSELTQIFAGGSQFYKIKFLLNVEVGLQEKMVVHHLELGNIPIYITYEKLPRICLFCAQIGHEVDGCAEKLRLERLRLDPRFSDLPHMQKPIKPKVGAWINNNAVILIHGTRANSHIETGPPACNQNQSRGLHMVQTLTQDLNGAAIYVEQ